MRAGTPDAPRAVVFCCRGGAQGALGAVRSLGREGVSVAVVAEYEEAVPLRSRYAQETHVLPGMFERPEEGVAFLTEYARGRSDRPVLVPTADPDLVFLARNRERLEEHCDLAVPRTDLVETLVDKEKFAAFARRHDFPVPATVSPRSLAELEELTGSLRFPVILKPTVPQSWSQPEIARIVDDKKALRIDDPASLRERYRGIAGLDPAMVVQEYVPGRDDRLYSLHMYLDGESRVAAAFTGRKIRTYPAYAGIGCFVESVRVPDLVETGRDLLRRVDYTGPALLQFKEDPRDGAFRLLEINPRISSWNVLAYACGVNIPLLAYRDAAGMPLDGSDGQRQDVHYVYLEHDLRAVREYRREDDWTWWSWLRSLRGEKVFEFFATDDPRPWVAATASVVATVTRRLLRAVGVGR